MTAARWFGEAVSAERSRLLDRALKVDDGPMWERVVISSTRARDEDARLARLIRLGEAVDQATELSADHPSGLGTFAQGHNWLLRKLKAAGEPS